MIDEDPPGTVGYRRPPRSRQFKPGQSGNPKGRPKGSKNFATAIAAELNAPIVATENGRRRTISKRQAVAKQLVNKAVAGDVKAIPILLNETRLHEASINELSRREAPGGTEDELVMASILRRIRTATDESAGSRVTPQQVPEASSEEPGAPTTDAGHDTDA